MSQIRNNLDALQRRAATHASTSGATASITTATPVQKVNKFKPAKTTTPSIAPARKTPPLKGLPSFSTPGFGKMKPAAPAVSRVRATGSHETIDISSSDSSPPSPASIPAKRASSDTEASLGVPTSPKRHKVAAVANKENLSYVTPSSWKGKGKETYVDELASNSTLEVAEPFVASGSLSNISVANRSLPSITPVPSVGTEHTDLQSKSAEELKNLYSWNHDALTEARRRKVDFRLGKAKDVDPWLLEETIKLLDKRISAIDAMLEYQESHSTIAPSQHTLHTSLSTSLVSLSARHDPGPSSSLIPNRAALTPAPPAPQPAATPFVEYIKPPLPPPQKQRPAFSAADEATFMDDTPASMSEDEMWAVLDNPEADDDDDIEIVETPQAVVSAATASSSTASVYAQSRYYAEAFDVLKKVFKLPSFHDHQLGAIISYLEGHDVVCYFPTGGGKSLCFQLPALCQGGKTKGVTIVIVPLRALMEDQVTKLRGLNVDVVEFSPETTQAVKQRIFDQRWYPNLIYITPEKWSTGDGAKSLITELYRRKVLARFAVDEAHLLSTWGKTFRSEGFKGLRDLRTEYPEIPIMAVTATATPQVQQEIMGILNLHEPKVFSQSANRPNLRYTILPKPKGIVPLIMAYIREKHPQDVGIVYCLSRKSCEKVAEEMSRNGLSARHYHAQVDKEEQKSLVDAWRRGDCKIIVATIAFGMGVDKPDVRFVIHHDVPMSIAGYLQETGRAGRDGKVADCVLYWNWAEKKKFTSFIDKDEDLDDEQKAKQKEDITEMFEYCHNQVDCRRLLLLRKYGENFEREDCQATCDNCLSHKDDTTITQDVTDIALSLVKFAVNVERSCTLVSKSNFILGFRGSNAKSVRDKGLVDVDGYGSGKQVEQQIVDRLYDELISRDIVESYLVQQPRTKYSNQYMKPGPGARPFLRERPPVLLRVGGKQSGKPDSKAPTSSRAPRSRRKGPRQELADDPIEDATVSLYAGDLSFPDEEPSNVQPSRADDGPSRFKAAPPLLEDRDSVVDLTIDESQTETEEDLNAQCYKELLAGRRAEREIDGTITDDQEVLADETLQLLSVMLPADAQSFKNALGMSPDADDSDEKYRSYGRKFLDVTTKYFMQAKPQPPPTTTFGSSRFHAATMHERFEYRK